MCIQHQDMQEMYNYRVSRLRGLGVQIKCHSGMMSSFFYVQNIQVLECHFKVNSAHACAIRLPANDRAQKIPSGVSKDTYD
jgi:hypothetical protein